MFDREQNFLVISVTHFEPEHLKFDRISNSTELALMRRAPGIFRFHHRNFYEKANGYNILILLSFDKSEDSSFMKDHTEGKTKICFFI